MEPSHTGVSIQALNCCSSSAHPEALYPDEAQQPARHSRQRIDTTKAAGEQHVPKTDVIIPRHGLTSVLFGRRTRSLGRGGNRVGVSFVDLAGMVAKVWRVPEKDS